MLVLGLEASCDETACAVVRDDGCVLSDVIHTQTSLHAPHGGVVPEVASRDHVRHVSRVVERALVEAGVRLDDVDAIAVTARPGLLGALLVGVEFAKALSLGPSRSASLRATPASPARPITPRRPSRTSRSSPAAGTPRSTS